MRHSDRVLALLAGGLLLLAASGLDAGLRRQAAVAELRQQRATVQALELTDLCLFTEARYTRHLSQADLHTPFQDHPLAFDHFPSGSLVSPPLRRE